MLRCHYISGALSITRFSIMTFNIKGLFVTLSINDTLYRVSLCRRWHSVYCFAECQYAECRNAESHGAAYFIRTLFVRNWRKYLFNDANICLIAVKRTYLRKALCNFYQKKFYKSFFLHFDSLIGNGKITVLSIC